MPEMLEIRWHARGGQGAVTASKVLADSSLEAGKHVQSFPEYGSERMGAPIKAFNRISKEPITIYSSVTNPDIVITECHIPPTSQRVPRGQSAGQCFATCHTHGIS